MLSIYRVFLHTVSHRYVQELRNKQLRELQYVYHSLWKMQQLAQAAPQEELRKACS